MESDTKRRDLNALAILCWFWMVASVQVLQVNLPLFWEHSVWVRCWYCLWSRDQWGPRNTGETSLELSMYLYLVGGLNPSEKYQSNWIISPGIGVKIPKIFELPPARYIHMLGFLHTHLLTNLQMFPQTTWSWTGQTHTLRWKGLTVSTVPYPTRLRKSVQLDTVNDDKCKCHTCWTLNYPANYESQIGGS